MEKNIKQKQHSLPILNKADLNLLLLYPSAAIVINASGDVVCANEQACNLLGYKQKLLLTMSAEKLMSKKFRNEYLKQQKASIESPTQQRSSEQNNFTIKTKNKHERHVTIAFNPVLLNDEPHAICGIFDETERFKYEEQLKSHVDVTQLIYNTTIAASNENLTFDECINRCLSSVCKVLHYPVGHVYYPSKDESILNPSNIWYLEDENRGKRFHKITMKSQFKMGIGLPGKIWKSKKAAWIEDVYKDKKFLRAVACKDLGVHSAVGFPVLVNKKVIAIFELFKYDASPKDEELLRQFKVLSEQMGRVYERRENQLALSKSQEQLHQSQKLESIGQLVGGIAHDFNNILCIILGEVRMFKKEHRRCSDYKSRKRIEVIELSAMRASDLTQKLLGFIRKSQCKKEPASLNRVVRECKDILKNTIDKRIKIYTYLDQSLKQIECDSSQMMQALMNLMLNARDAMQNGGDVRIETNNVSGKEVVNAGYNAELEKDYVKLTITDTGCGISHENLKKIYEPFFTSKPQPNGTGLGLSLVYEIVQKHDGVIDVKSQIGKGTVFTLYFPASDYIIEETYITQNNRNNVTCEETLSGLRILVVDDEELLVEIAKKNLSIQGADVIGISDASSALSLIVQNDLNFDLIILDIAMPLANGYELLKKIQEKKPAQKVILMRGYTVKDIHNPLKDDQRIAFLQKPYTQESLINTIKQLLRIRRGDQ